MDLYEVSLMGSFCRLLPTDGITVRNFYLKKQKKRGTVIQHITLHIRFFGVQCFYKTFYESGALKDICRIQGKKQQNIIYSDIC